MRTRWIDESLISIQGERATVKRDMVKSEVVVRPKAGKPQWDSKLELAYSQFLDALKHSGDTIEYYYHPFTLVLPGNVRYTPDFMLWTALNRYEIHECKGSPKMKNARDGITRLKVAAGTFKCYDFKLVYRKKGQWEITTI